MLNKSPRAFAVCSKNKETLFKSSSGGVFYLIAHEILTKYNGVVYGSAIENARVFHKRIDDLSSLNLLTKSKYVVSDLKNCLKECAEDLSANRYVFFVGTGCQIAALDSFLTVKQISKERLITADLICHGAPKKKYFELYLKELFPNSSNLEVDFKYKKPSWENYSIRIKSGKKIIVESHDTNAYFNAFLGNYILLDSCYDCKFKGENRYSDITLGDFWGCSEYYPEFFNKFGTSLVIVHKKEDFILNILHKYATVNEVDYHLSLKNNESYFVSSKKPKNFENRVKSIETNGFIKTFSIKEPPKKSIKNYLKRNIKKIICLNYKKPKIDNKTIGIVTDYGYFNFGNRLQNYALRDLISKKGYKSLNICFDKTANIRKAVYLKYFIFKNKQIEREHSIYKASKKSGDRTFLFDFSKQSKRKAGKFGMVLLGSDQIWNTHYNKKNLHFHLGSFGLSKKLKMSSYAASFGVKCIPERYKQIFMDKLANLDKVGVRELEGTRILSEIGIKSELNLDPVFLLTSLDWKKSYKFCSSLNPPQKYVFEYVLYSDEEFSIPKPYKELNVLNILDEKSSYFVCNQFDFVRFIQNAELVVTNSFHALVFSMIFKRKVFLLEREEMMARFTSIFDILGIDDFLHKVIDFQFIDLTKFDVLKAKSMLFLQQIFDDLN